MIKDMVSIIVPVYNVEKYIEKCLSSLASQTYDSLEFILVSDGSKDGSDVICKRFAAADKRFRYFRKENEGVSAARNYGISRARGEYYLFVDSDDYIDSDMVEKMTAVMKKENADIVQCFYRIEFKFGFMMRRAPSYQVMDQLSALTQLLKNTKVNNYPWGKLYRASVFENVEFPAKWRVFEDVCTVFKLFLNADVIVTMPNRFYHYVQRKGSFMNTNGIFSMDMDTLLMMRPAFEYQELMLRQAYPSAQISNWQNYFVSNLLVLYSLIFFVKRSEVHKYTVPALDFEGHPFYYRYVYRLCVLIAKMKFGKNLQMQDLSLMKKAKDKRRLPQES